MHNCIYAPKPFSLYYRLTLSEKTNELILSIENLNNIIGIFQLKLQWYLYNIIIQKGEKEKIFSFWLLNHSKENI